jgi:hypothetical protein
MVMCRLLLSTGRGINNLFTSVKEIAQTHTCDEVLEELVHTHMGSETIKK